jgi:GNAT superfamily N-acetyltransferase
VLTNFRDALTSVYCGQPCQVLPNALWKTLAEADGAGYQTAVVRADDAITHCALWDGQRLLVYWNRDRNCTDHLHHRVEDVHFALIHQDFLHIIPTTKFPHRRSYFRLICQEGSMVKPPLPQGFRVVPVDIARDISMVAELIGKCYMQLHPSEDTVRGWTEHPVFDQDLWVWIVETQTNLPVALGIAEMDRDIAEGSLEWIQVLPAHRGRGLGKALVNELLFRLQDRAAFTTVAGEVDNRSDPEALYRSCGFTGSDLWWVMTT